MFINTNGLVFIFVPPLSRPSRGYLEVGVWYIDVFFSWVTPQFAIHVTFYFNNFCISQGKKLSIYATAFFVYIGIVGFMGKPPTSNILKPHHHGGAM